jgi:non-specific serine/threonine protein kinase
MMLTGRAPPESAMAGNSKPSGEPGSITRSARARDPGRAGAAGRSGAAGRPSRRPKTAGALRDALTAFIWNERAENVAPNSLGIPLAPPPLRAPVHVATITPDDNVAPLREVLATAPVPATVARPAPTHPIPTAAPAADATAPVAAETTLLAPVPPAPAPAPIVPGAGETGPSAFDPHALLEALRPWAIKYRVPLFAVGAFFSLSIFLGVLLGNLRHTPPAATTPASVDSGTAGDTATAADRPASGPKAPVSFDIRPWGEIFIDGKATGVSPPMTQLELTERPSPHRNPP